MLHNQKERKRDGGIVKDGKGDEAISGTLIWKESDHEKRGNKPTTTGVSTTISSRPT